MAINKIKSGSIEDNAITSAKVADGVISAADVADGTLTDAKLNSTLDLSSKTITLPNTSVTNDMLAGSIANSKLANSSITLNGSAVSLGGSATIGGTNTPAFKATASANQSIATNTTTKIEFDTEDFDTDSAYDTTNDRFIVPSGKAGKYFFNTAIRISGLNDGDIIDLIFYVNGTEVTENRQRKRLGSAGTIYLQCSMIKALSVGDYVEVFTFHNNGSSKDTQNQYLSFQGYKLVE